jgi:hypothetical protein
MCPDPVHESRATAPQTQTPNAPETLPRPLRDAGDKRTIPIWSVGRTEAGVSGGESSVTDPAKLPTGHRYQVVIVGSPGEAEKAAGHMYQFVRAAESAGVGPDTVWLVERSGYERAQADLAEIRRRAGTAYLFWTDESRSLTDLLNAFPSGSIGEMSAYSHGLPGLLALRHGWPGVRDYGLTTGQARALAPSVFAKDALISFDSCNSATPQDGESLAQVTAQAAGHAVTGWTGRTSYHDYNAQDEDQPQVQPSEIVRDGHPDFGEFWSQLRGRYPRREAIAPRTVPGGFSAWFSMRARLAATRTFSVPAGGWVYAVIESSSETVGIRGLRGDVLLHRSERHRIGSDPTEGTPGTFVVGESSKVGWTELQGGTYFLELYHLSGEPVTGQLTVEIKAP